MELEQVRQLLQGLPANVAIFAIISIYFMPRLLKLLGTFLPEYLQYLKDREESKKKEIYKILELLQNRHEKLTEEINLLEKQVKKWSEEYYSLQETYNNLKIQCKKFEARLIDLEKQPKKIT